MSFTFAGMIRDLACHRGDAPALAFGDSVTTFAELDARSSRLAGALLAAGLSAGDRVGFLGKNCPEFFELLSACSKIGAILAGLNWRLSPQELTTIAIDAELSAVFVSRDLVDRLRDAMSVRSLVMVELGDDYENLIRDGEVPVQWPSIDGETVVLQLYSSGTTGVPRGTLVTNANLAFTQVTASELYGMDETTVNLVVSPLFHIGGAGYGITALSRGGLTVLMPDPTPAAMLEAISTHRVTHSFQVPALIHSLVHAPDVRNADISSLRLIAYGGAPMNEALLLDAIRVLGCEFMGVYGMTETSGTVVALLPADHDPSGSRSHLLRSIGKPMAWIGEVEIVNSQTGEPVAPGEVGEIWVRSGQVTPGYWRNPEATVQAISAEGWLHTGDAAYRDDEGFFFLHDRIKDMIITGGENVYPAEVENAMAFHPSISEVAVIGVPSQKWGETVKAIVVLKSGCEAGEAELIAFTRDRLAHYKCPTSVDFTQALPRNASGKVLKKDLRAPYWAETHHR